jgi:hypothetical protein
MRKQLLTDNEDLAWLLDVHIKQDVPVFRAAIIHGNEDCPERIELFEANEPLITDEPIAAFVLTDDLDYRRV